MRIALALIIAPFLSLAQTNLSDNFSDGDFTLNPVWLGDTAFFKVNQAKELQLQDSVAGTRYLSTASGISQEATWEFYLRMDFNPSGSNYAKVYLMSDQLDLNGSLNGYFVRVSGSSDDRISLFRQDGSGTKLIAESGDDWVDNDPVEVRVKVERGVNDLWSLSADTTGGTNYQLLGSAVDSTHDFSTHLGVAPQYTVTRADKFFFDDFQWVGKVYQDTVPPSIQAVEVLDSVTIELVFSESLDTLSAEDENNYTLSPLLGSPSNAGLVPGSSRKVLLNFDLEIPSRTILELSVSGVGDRFGNPINEKVEFLRYEPLAGDVVINELMIDPNPVIGIPPNALPEREYIELHNRSSLPISLENWQLQAGSSIEVLPEYTLKPDTFVVITKDDGVNEFPMGLPILGLDMSSVALTNGGTNVSLSHPEGLVISTVTYNDGWYGNELKADGGWSLEQIDPDNLCGGASNWMASESPIGGTPGKTNSVFGVNPDTTRPRMERIAIVGDSTILLFFSERVNEKLLAETSNYIIEPQLIVLSAEPVFPSLNQVEIRFNAPIDPQVIYSLGLDSLPMDCSGNPTLWDSLLFTIPATPGPGELLINELLFDPPSGGSDFVEVYNNSQKIFDLSKLRLGNWDAALQTAVELEELREKSFLIEPGRYLALTEDVAFLKDNYSIEEPNNLVEVMDLPSLPNDEGSVALTTASLEMIEYFEYNDDMHLPVLDDPDGVSLERLSFDKPVNEDDNWHSAASTTGFATPGYRNSQALTTVNNAEVSLEPKVFSPNQDGYNDVLIINYLFDQPDNVVTLSVWSSAGYQLRELQNNTSVGSQGFFSWDGTDEQGQLLSSGIYIVVFEYFNPDGASEVIRKTCVLSL